MFATTGPWVEDESPYWFYFSQVVPVKLVEFTGAVGMFEVLHAGTPGRFHFGRHRGW